MSLTLDDLIKECLICNGTGKRQQTSNPSGGRSIGQPQVFQVWGDDNCETCGGDGRVELTESGDAIRRFIQILKKRGQA
jgi:RecJ-like exonuclease